MVWDNFKRLCKERGISASSALNDLGISQGMPSAWKRGVSPRVDTIERMANYIGVSPAELLDESTDGKNLISKSPLPPQNQKRFKENFVRLCNKKGVSPTKAVTSIGLSESVYSNWTEKTVPRRATLLKLAEYFDCTVDDLLADGAEIKKPPAKAEGEEPPYMVSVLKAADSVPADKREDFLQTVEAIARMYERKGQ